MEEEPGGLQSMGSETVENDWACMHAYMLILNSRFVPSPDFPFSNKFIFYFIYIYI